MSGPTLASRFSLLPRMQEERQQESTMQAQQAEQLTNRLQDTMEQAERIFKQEIDHTRSLEIALLESHPDWVNWNSNYKETKRKAEDWEFQHQTRKNDLKKQLDAENMYLDAKESLIKRLEQEQQVARDKYQELERQRAALMGQLDEAKHGEAQARERVNPVDDQVGLLKQRVSDLEGNLEPIVRRQYSVEPEVEAAKRNRSQLESQVQSLQHQLEPVEGDYARLEERRACVLNDIAKADGLVEEAQQAVGEHQALYNSLQSNVKSSEERLFKARNAAQNALQLKGKAAELIKVSNEKLAAVRSENQGLRARRDEIQAQIDQLLREQARVIDQMNHVSVRENTILEEIHCLENDQREAASFYEAAMESQRQIETNSRQANESFAREKKLIEEFMAKKRDAEIEKNKAQTLLGEAESQIDRIMTRRTDILRHVENAQNRLCEHDSHWNQLEMERSRLAEQIRNLEDQLSFAKTQLQGLVEERRSAIEFMNNCTNSIRFLTRQMTDLQASMQSLPTRQEDRIRGLMAEIEQHRNRVDELWRQYNMPEENNPFKERLQTLEYEKDSLINRVKEDLYKNPPSELTDQLKREAEAIMRAELAAGLYSRQVLIREETKELSQVRPVHEPRFSIDQQATGRLFGEHLESADYRRIASTVVEMAEQSHIVAQ